jgi:hypothetical protein
MSDAVVITAQPTPNPNAAKFTLNRIVATQGRTYREAAGTEAEWAKRLLEITGITQIFALNNFVSITKTSDADWNVLGPEVERILREAFA